MSETAESETIVWQGGPTQWLGAGWYLLTLLVIVAIFALQIWLRAWPVEWSLAAAALALIPALGVWVSLSTVRYQLTTQRLRTYRGLLVRRVDEVELYRVRDTTVVEPLNLRLLGCGHVVLLTSDLSSPQLVLRAVARPQQVRGLLRDLVEQVRQAKGVRAVDME